MGLQEAYDRCLPLIEADLRDVILCSSPGLETYYGMMRYHLGWVDESFKPLTDHSGKRLRPMLCLLCCEAAGGDPSQALPAASAVELVHNFSLVHDDIQDGSPTRRGRRAAWAVWGAPHGINVGDGLFVLARLSLNRLERKGVSLPRILSATGALDRACLALCEGQFFDMTFEERVDVDLDHYLWMIQHKTGALLAASAQLGAIVATDDEEQIELYRRFGENLGIAFQIQDDVLGAWGDESATGKSAATDIRDKKKTFPVVFALGHRENQDAVRELNGLYAQAGPLDEGSIQRALGILDEMGARQHAEAMAKEYYLRALHDLERTAENGEPQDALRELAASLMGRQA
ncbi:polyprenyl synthetase family protein [Chloroflexota bacterium]